MKPLPQRECGRLIEVRVSLGESWYVRCWREPNHMGVCSVDVAWLAQKAATR